MTYHRTQQLLFYVQLALISLAVGALVAWEYAEVISTDTMLGLLLFALIGHDRINEIAWQRKLTHERQQMQRQLAEWKRSAERAAFQANMASYTASMYRLAYEAEVRQRVDRPREHLN